MFTHPASGYTKDGLRFFSEYDICRQGMSLYVMRRDPENRMETTQIGTIVWNEMEQYSYTVPTLTCDPESIQCLFNSLWERGFRPSSPMSPDEITKAKDKHLEDLRKIVFKQLDIPLS
jgi:hypothetical protein